MKNKNVGLDKILAKELKSGDFKIAYDEYHFYLQVAHLISNLRQVSGITQKDLAKKAGVSQPMIGRLEKGDPSRQPTFETISKLLKILGYKIVFNIQRAA